MNQNRDDNITFTINQVAKMLGVVSATIRNWEKSGLITVRRSASNYRVFTLDDIELLKKIREYSIDKHMGTHAIKLLLPTGSDSEIAKYVDQQKENIYSKKLISKKWKEIREQQGYTLEEVSRELGISAAHLSKLENGNANLSLDILNRLALFYHESPLYFMEQTDAESRLVRKGCGEPIQLKSDPGLEMYSLISLKEHMMYPVLCIVEPGCGNLVPHTHKGEELIYILSGVIEMTVNNDAPYILHPGDTFYYKGADTHSWVNISTKPAKLLWVHSSLSI